MSLATQEGISVALDYRYFGAVNDTAAVPAVRAIKASGLKAVIVYLNEQVRAFDDSLKPPHFTLCRRSTRNCSSTRCMWRAS